MSKEFKEHDLVWAKMRGYPAWPARVQKPPKGEKVQANKLYIFFYGSHNHAWMSPVDLYPYEDLKEKFRKPQKKRKGFAEAIWEIEEDPSLTISLSVQLPNKKRGRKKSVASDDTTQTGRSPPGKGRKRQVTSSDGATPPTKKIKTEEGGGGGGETSTSEESQTVLDTSTSQELSSQEQTDCVTQSGTRRHSRSQVSPPALSVSPSASVNTSITVKQEPDFCEMVDTGVPTDGTKEETKVGEKQKEKWEKDEKEEKNQRCSRRSTRSSCKASNEKNTQPVIQSSSSQEEGGALKKYATRCRHNSSGSFVEQLTQNYTARKEHLGSPLSSPMAAKGVAKRVKSKKEQAEAPKLETAVTTDAGGGRVAVKRAGRRRKSNAESGVPCRRTSGVSPKVSKKGTCTSVQIKKELVELETEALQSLPVVDNGGPGVMCVEGQRRGKTEGVDMGGNTSTKEVAVGLAQTSPVELRESGAEQQKDLLAGGGDGRQTECEREKPNDIMEVDVSQIAAVGGTGDSPLVVCGNKSEGDTEQRQLAGKEEGGVGGRQQALMEVEGVGQQPSRRVEEGSRQLSKEEEKSEQSSKEEGGSQLSLKEKGESYQPLKEESKSQLPLKEESKSQQLSKEKEESHQPLKEVGKSQQPLKEKGECQQSLEKGASQQLLKEKEESQELSKEEGKIQQPLKEKGASQQLSKENESQQPSKEMGKIQQPLNDGTSQQLSKEKDECQKEESQQGLKEKGASQQSLKSKDGKGLDSQREGNMSGQNGEVNASTDENPTIKLSIDELPRAIPIQPGMNNVEMLQAYNYNLMAALTIEAPNVPQAMVVLRDILDLQCTTTDLEKVPHLVYTIRKLKHYRASQKVIKKAEEVYHKLKGLYLRPNQVVQPPRKRTFTGGIRQRLQRPPVQPVTTAVATAANDKATANDTREGEVKDVISNKPSVQQEKQAAVPVVPKAPSPVQVKEETPVSLRRSSRATVQSKVDYSKMVQSSGESSGTEGDDQTVPT